MKDGGDGREPYRIKIGFALEKIKAAQRGRRDGRLLLWRSRSGCHPMPPGLSEMRWKISREQNFKCATKTAPQNEGMCSTDWTNENIGLERSMRVPLKRRKRGGCSLSSFVFIKAVQGDSGGLTARLG